MHQRHSRQEGLIDYSNAARQIEDQSEQILQRIDEMACQIDDPQLDQVREKLELIDSLMSNKNDPETSKQAMDDIQEAKCQVP